MHGRLNIGGYHGNILRYMVHFSIKGIGSQRISLISEESGWRD